MMLETIGDVRPSVLHADPRRILGLRPLWKPHAEAELAVRTFAARCGSSRLPLFPGTMICIQRWVLKERERSRRKPAPHLTPGVGVDRH
jgi:hypothetical protein